MRLFLLPISTRRNLIYCQRINQQLSSKQTYLDAITTRASTQWVKWEKYEKGWQKKVTDYGNLLFQRIPFEEWGLKSIPPITARRKVEELGETEPINVVFPSSIVAQSDVLDRLRRIGTERQAFHRQRMIWSIAFMPISMPFALIPVIPNIPFFYLVFRAWSHWRALSGSKHVEFLLEKNLIRASSSAVLDICYAIGETDAFITKSRNDLKALGTPSDDSKSANVDIAEEMLLSKSDGKLISDITEIPQLEAEIERAVHQVEHSMSANLKMQQEQQESDLVTRGQKHQK